MPVGRNPLFKSVPPVAVVLATASDLPFPQRSKTEPNI